MKFILRWLLAALVLLLIANFVPGIALTGWYAAIITVAILGLVNAIIRPIIVLLTLPINILTLGLFSFVINALLIWFVATIVQGFSVDGFVAALIAAILLAAANAVISFFLKK